jgi:hypothetical protein
MYIHYVKRDIYCKIAELAQWPLIRPNGSLVIIDFSRSIVNPYHIGVSQNTSSNVDVIAQEQAQLLEQMYARLLPNDDHYDKVSALLKYDYELAFHILSLLDMINVIDSIIKQSTTDRIVEVAKALLKKLVANMHKLIDSRKLTVPDPLYMFLEDQHLDPVDHNDTSVINLDPMQFDCGSLMQMS